MANVRTRGSGEDGGGTEEQTPPARLDTMDQQLEAFVSKDGPAIARGEALQTLTRASADAEKLDERHLQDRYEVGERLVEFAARRGHVALGYRNLGACFRERFQLGRTWAFDSMRLSKAATRADLPGLTWTVAKLGLRLAELLDVGSLGALKKQALPVPSRTGEPVHFPAPPDVLELAIAELERRQQPEPAEEPEPRSVERAAVKRAQAIVDEHLERHPALAEARPTVYLRDGTAQVKIGAVELRGDTFAAVVKLFAAIERSLRPG